MEEEALSARDCRLCLTKGVSTQVLLKMFGDKEVYQGAELTASDIVLVLRVCYVKKVERELEEASSR